MVHIDLTGRVSTTDPTLVDFKREIMGEKL